MCLAVTFNVKQLYEQMADSHISLHMINLLYFNISAKGHFQEKTCTLVSTT